MILCSLCLNLDVESKYHFIIKYNIYTEKCIKQKWTAKKKKNVEGSDLSQKNTCEINFQVKI